MFKNEVEAQYEIVEADLKSILKKVAATLFGMISITQTALGFNLKDPQKIGRASEHLIKEIAQADGEMGQYKIATKVHQKGGLQVVEWEIVKDGHHLGEVVFVGTQTDVINSVQVRLTDQGREDEPTQALTDKMVHALRERIMKAS